MPGKVTKGDGKKVEKQPKPAEHIVTVKECLAWPNSGETTSQKPSSQEVKFEAYLPKHGELGRPIDRGYVMPEHPVQKDKKDEGSAQEALRGWPKTANIGQAGEDQYCFRNDTECETVIAKPQAGGAKPAGGKTGKSKTGKKPSKEDKQDPSMGDLMSNRFQNEYTQGRQDELEREAKKQADKERAAREGRRMAKDRANIKANRTAQLRAIANAEHIETDPKDLWKMSKFTKNAKPNVCSFRHGGENGSQRGDGGHYNASGDYGTYGCAGSCTCDLGQSPALPYGPDDDEFQPEVQADSCVGVTSPVCAGAY